MTPLFRITLVVLSLVAFFGWIALSALTALH